MLCPRVCLRLVFAARQFWLTSGKDARLVAVQGLVSGRNRVSLFLSLRFVFMIFETIFAILIREYQACQPTHPSIANFAWAWSAAARALSSAAFTPRRRCSTTAPPWL